MLSGLGAEATAAPIAPVYRPFPDLILTPAPIETDLDFPAPEIADDDSLPTAADFDLTDLPADSVAADSVALPSSLAPGSQKVPEPPPARLLLIGFAIVALPTLFRRRKRIRYRPGRRLTALR